MSKIAIHLGHPLIDGEHVTFRSPCASTDATGLKIYTPTSYEDDTEISAVYDLKDAGGTTIHGKAGLFASGAYVTVGLDTTNAIAYIHNARSIYQAELDTKLDKNGDAANAKIGSSTASTASYPIPAANDTFKVILGKIIKFFGDIKGAITSLSISGKTITWTKADGTTGTLTTQDTTYTAGTGLSLSSGKFNHSNAVTAGTAGTSSATSAQNTLAVPYVTYDAQGHVTASGTHTHTINGMGAATASAAGKTGLVPAPAAGNQIAYLRGDGTWKAPVFNQNVATAGFALDAREANPNITGSMAAKLKSQLDEKLDTDGGYIGTTVIGSEIAATQPYQAIDVEDTVADAVGKINYTIQQTKQALSGVGVSQSVLAISEDKTLNDKTLIGTFTLNPGTWAIETFVRLHNIPANTKYSLYLGTLTTTALSSNSSGQTSSHIGNAVSGYFGTSFVRLFRVTADTDINLIVQANSGGCDVARVTKYKIANA